MFHIQDLNIEEDLLPILNYTRNDNSKRILLGFFKTGLSSVKDIVARQEILKGFLSQHHLLKNFAYSRYDLMEVVDFLKPKNFKLSTHQNNQKLQLMFSEHKKHKLTGELIQAVLLLHKFKNFYFFRLSIQAFPAQYGKQLTEMNDFLNAIGLDHYEEIIRSQKFKIKHIIELRSIFTRLIERGEMDQFWEQCFTFEAYLSLSLAIHKNGWVFPQFSNNEFSIEAFYHPAIKDPVKNSIKGNQNVILLSGPNMSGKSTLLKSLGIVMLLGSAGMAVPASRARIPFIDSLSVCLHLHDQIRSGYSHFMSEIVSLKEVILDVKSGNRHFAIFDELFRGTNHDDALHISKTTIRGLARFKSSFFIISTHHEELSQIPEVINQEVDTYYIDCELIDKVPVFNYHLKKGWTELKLGRVLFEKEGLEELLG